MTATMTATELLFDRVGSVTTRPALAPPGPLEPGDVRIAPRYLGICGSDLHLLAGRHPYARPPKVPGHEICAEVIEVGSAVTGIAAGDRAVIDPIMPCGHCRACRAGRYNLCEPPMVAGFRAPGFGRTSHVVPGRNVHVAPATIPWRALALAEPATCAYHCVSRLAPDVLEDVLVIGAGTIGLAIVQALRNGGAGRITVSEPDRRKRALAGSLGADLAVAPGTLARHDCFTAVIDVVASASTLAEACACALPGGTVLVMGVPDGPRELPLPMMQRFERDLIGSGMYVPADFDAVIAWLDAGRFETEPLISEVFDLATAPAAFARAAEPDSIKVLLRMA